MRTNMRVEVDREANAGYVQLRGGRVASTKEAAPGVLVDLDEFGCVLGVELIGLGTRVPVSDLIERYHVHTEDQENLRSVAPSLAATYGLDATFGSDSRIEASGSNHNTPTAA